MIKKNILFWAFSSFVFITTTFSQIQISIKSASDSSDLAFATVFNLSKKVFSSANEKGIFKIALDQSDSFRISYIGYDDLSYIPNTSNKVDTLYLIRKALPLKEIVIQTCKSTYDERVSNYSKSNKQELFGGVMCTKGETNGKVAIHIISSKNMGVLSTISFWLNKLSFMPEFAVKSPLAISFYSCSEISLLPDVLLYEKPIFYFPKKDGKQKLNIDSLNFHMPPEGIFVCFEFIADERYQWEQKVNDSIVVNQGVAIAGTKSEGYELAFFDYRVNGWKKFEHQKSDNSHGTIKLETVYRYCKN